MKIQTAGRVHRIGFATVAFALAFLACGPAMASDVEWQIPMIRDTFGSSLTMEISREGTRQTATPFFTLNNPTVRRIEERIGKWIDRLAAKEISLEATAGNSISRVGLAGTPTENSGRPDTILSSLPPVPGEITVRNVKRFLKGLRASHKERLAPAVAVAVPELRLGRTDTSQREN